MEGLRVPMFARALEFERELLFGSASQVIDLPFGAVVLNGDFPIAHSHNLVVIDRDVDARAVLERVEAILETAGVRFRVLSVRDEACADSLQHDLATAGYERSTDLLMALVASPEKSSTHAGDHVPFEEARPWIEAAWRRYGMSVADAQQLTARVRTYDGVCEVRHFGVRVEGELVSRCDLLVLGATAEIDGVLTDPPWEGRGYATAAISAAVADARRSGCDLIFLQTDADDWPQHLFRRLGFREVGRTYSFERAYEASRALPAV
jgi:GNAT superfamily N-acetyltransferase